MRAAQINSYGGPTVLRLTTTAAKPTPAAGQILVAVQAAGVNPFDWKVREGLVRQMAELDFPATLGGDLAGTVVALGDGVTGFTVGQAVYGQAGALSSQGSFAEYAPVKATQLAAKPKTTDFIRAAALPLVSASAYQALVDHMQLQAGQKILIHGGAGGIGSLAIPLAKHLGAYVATTVTAADAEFVKSRGADEIIDYTSQDFSELIRDYDAVFDTVGGVTNAKSYLVLKSGGVLVSMVEQPDAALVTKYAIRYVAQFTQTTTERLSRIAELVDAGVLSATVEKIFPLDQASEALDYIHTNHPRGKVVIAVLED